jgi:hypothetical protein
LKKVLQYPHDLDMHHKMILSTDQKTNMIYVYKSNVITGHNIIELYAYENNIVYSKPARTLSDQIWALTKDQIDKYGPSECTNKI